MRAGEIGNERHANNVLFVKKFCKLLVLRENFLPTTAWYKNILVSTAKLCGVLLRMVGVGVKGQITFFWIIAHFVGWLVWPALSYSHYVSCVFYLCTRRFHCIFLLSFFAWLDLPNENYMILILKWFRSGMAGLCNTVVAVCSWSLWRKNQQNGNQGFNKSLRESDALSF